MKMSWPRRIIIGIAALVLACVVIAALFAPWVATHDPQASSLGESLLRPSTDHWLGTDQLGRDTFSRVVYGARVALLAAAEATIIAVAIGVPLGLLIGFKAGRVDQMSMRVIDGISSIPGVVLAIALIAALGSGLSRSMLAVGIVFSMVVARIARGQVLAERERQYVDGARVVGVHSRALLFGHVLPNVAPALIVQATLVFSSAIAIEAGLSFIGLGVQPPTASWGIMLSDSQDVIPIDAFQAVPPGFAIVLTVLAINVLGDHLQGVIIGNQGAGRGTVLRPAPVERAAPAAAALVTDDALLVVDGMDVTYVAADGRRVTAVSDVTLHVARGEVLAVVGESGCGKSSLGLGIAGLLAPPAAMHARSLRMHTRDGVVEVAGDQGASQAAWRHHLAVVFQEPAASLNPVHSVGRHLERALRHRGVPRDECRARSLTLLEEVRISDPADVLRRYPHQLSGGMAQRVMIALALAQEPSLLMADEPTTALDVTVQAEILSLLRQLCRELDLSVLLITHDLGVVAELADRVAVMYAGEIVEIGPVLDVIASPRHPYTAALAASVPRNDATAGIPAPLEGTVPEPGRWPVGCRFAERCAHADDSCRTGAVPLTEVGGRQVACVRAAELTLAGVAPRGSA